MYCHQIGGWGWVAEAGSEWCPRASVSLLPFCDLSPLCPWGSSVPHVGSRSLHHHSPFLSETAARHSGSTRSHPVSGSSKSSTTERIKGAIHQFYKWKSFCLKAHYSVCESCCIMSFVALRGLSSGLLSQIYLGLGLESTNLKQLKPTLQSGGIEGKTWVFTR